MKIGNNPSIEITDFALTLDIAEELDPLLTEANFLKKEINELSPLRTPLIYKIVTTSNQIKLVKNDIERIDAIIQSSKDSKYIEIQSDKLKEKERELSQLTKEAIDLESEAISKQFTEDELSKFTREKSLVISKKQKEFNDLLIKISKAIIKVKCPEVNVNTIIDKKNLTASVLAEFISEIVKCEETKIAENFTDLIQQK